MIFFGAVCHILGPEHGFSNLCSEAKKKKKKPKRKTTEKDRVTRIIEERTKDLKNEMISGGIKLNNLN